MSWSERFYTAVIDSFNDFCATENYATYDTFQEYIEAWLRNGDAAEITGHDYATFLEAVLILIDDYAKNPQVVDASGRPDGPRPNRVLDLENPKRWCFDPRAYRAVSIKGW